MNEPTSRKVIVLSMIPIVVKITLKVGDTWVRLTKAAARDFVKRLPEEPIGYMRDYAAHVTDNPREGSDLTLVRK